MAFTQILQAIVNIFFQVFVIFPYSALTISRQRQLTSPDAIRSCKGSTQKETTKNLSRMLSEKVYKLCTSKESVSALLAQDPTMAPGDAWNELYGIHMTGYRDKKATAIAHLENYSPEDLQRTLECGNWGSTNPSELFLRMYHDAVCTIDKSVSGCMVSPSLMGSYGTIPLTVISVLPDIMRHMSNLIVRAEKEVILATNYWQNSVASKYITNAMKELSRRAGEQGDRIVFKVQYDRGSAKQLLENHYSVQEKEYTGKAVALPAPEDIPNIDLQVINYHKPMLGTFHCKYMVVDRKIAVLQSNNIQDNDNMEMMTHFEGPIVDSLYDMALISWHKRLEPPLPSHNSPAVQGGLESFANKTHDAIFSRTAALGISSKFTASDNLAAQKAYVHEPRSVNQPGIIPPGISNHTSGVNSADIVTGPSTTESVVHTADISGHVPNDALLVNQAPTPTNPSGISNDAHHEFKEGKLYSIAILQENARAVARTGDVEHIIHTHRGDTNSAGSSNGPKGPDQSNGTANRGSNGPDAKTREFLSSGEQELPDNQIKHPSPSEEILPEHTIDDPHYDVDIAGEVARVQATVSPKQGETRVEAVSRHLNHTKNVGFKGNAPECALGEEMTPYIPHPVHDPFPIAMVCREPHGPPNHNSVCNPQNEVWLSALRNAKKNVFIQSPTLNAEPLVPAIIEACERGIDVYCYICLGYNDAGELLPMQGGTNEMVAHKMYTSLSQEGKKRLHYHFYVGKDQTAPIVAKKKRRDCHIKVMIVDEHIGIQGNGNQDTQSWFHSQEINVMFDSASVCRAWIDGLRRNQNTHQYGEVSKEDGIWRDEGGEQASDVIGVNPGNFSWAKGFLGAIQRVRGAGDF